MRDAAYSEGPLTPAEREEYEEDLISVSDRELDLLGDLSGLDVLYAGGASLLWLEGLSLRVGSRGTVTALDSDEQKIQLAAELLEDADLKAPVRLVPGDVFDPPLAPRAFDLVYSAGLFHELDVSKRAAREALAALTALVRPGGRVATSDFISTVPAVQLEDEDLDRRRAALLHGSDLHGIGPPERLIALHEPVLTGISWKISAPRTIRHLDKLILASEEPDGPRHHLPPTTPRNLLERRAALLQRIRREGYTRPATVFLSGSPRGN